MRKFLLLTSTALIIGVICFAQSEALLDGKKVLLFNDGTWIFAETDTLYNLTATSIKSLEIPQIKPNETIISHTGFSLSFNPMHKQANWVAYELTEEETHKIYERSDDFTPDPKVKKGCANNKDYEGTGYDRGHLAPAADMCWNINTMTESFYYSNISPQIAGFNRGIWKRLEELVRCWAVDNKSVYIATGPVLSAGLQTIGKKVSVPNYYYKVILDYKEPGIKGIGFILQNTSSSGLLQEYAITIDSVEKFTGIDFFPSLPDDQEKIIESSINLQSWSWKSYSGGSKGKTSTSSVQCKGLTKSGTPCKNKTLNPSGFCYLHESQEENAENDKQTSTNAAEKNTTSSQCLGTTQSGNRCKNMTLNKSGYCYLHEDQSNSSTVKKTETKSSSNKTSGRTIYTGPRGGKYYINSSGNKVYIK